jgi:hypothetical protein
MDVAQIMVTPPAAVSVGSEMAGPANGALAAGEFQDRLFASMSAAVAAPAEQSPEGADPVEGTLQPEAAARAAANPQAAEMLAFIWNTASGHHGMLVEQPARTMLPEQKKATGRFLPVADLLDAVEEGALSGESTGRQEATALHFRETGNGVQVVVCLDEKCPPVEGDGTIRQDSDERKGFMTAVAVLQDVFGVTAPEANPGVPLLADTGSALNAIRGAHAPVGEGPAMQQAPALPGPDGDGAFRAPMENHLQQGNGTGGGDMVMTDDVTTLTVSPGTAGRNGVVEREGLHDGSQFEEVVKAVAVERNADSQRSTSVSTAPGQLRGAAVAKAYGMANDPDQDVSQRITEEAHGPAGNSMDAPLAANETGSPAGGTAGNDSFRQESSGGKPSREIFPHQDLTGRFETLHAAAPERTDTDAAPVDTGTLQETIMGQVREKLASTLSSRDSGQVTLQLNPRELGDLTIGIRMENQKITIDIAAQNPAVKEALLQQLDTLKDALGRQNITMERFDVSAGNGNGADHSHRQERQAAHHGADFPFQGNYREETAQVRNAEWLPRENALVDMRW